MRLFGSSRRPAQSKAENTHLVVVESGGAGSASRMAPGEGAVFVAQSGSESPLTFAHKVLGQIAGFERRRHAITPATLIVAGSAEPHQLAARALIARALLSHMAAHGAGDLIVQATDAEPEARDELLALVERLLEEHPESGVAIRLQFRPAPSGPRASGVYGVPSRDAAVSGDDTR